jgi:DNA polymerase-4
MYPRAILHFDGDSFFASVEQAMDYRLRGKPIVTGAERGAPTAVSYEAKKLGLARGMSMREIRRRCPQVIIVSSDYRSYAIFAHRMYSIVRSYTPVVEEYSIDECFADITGLDTKYGISYEELAERIKAELEDSLGITFGVGLSVNKSLAKAASKANKPAGLTSVPIEKISSFIESIDIQNIWGLGGVSGMKLRKLGAVTAGAFTQKPDAWLAEHHFGKQYRDIWLELQGHFIKQLTLPGQGNRVGSLMVTRTFRPIMGRFSIFSYLSKNVEQVCEKARHQGVEAAGFTFYLKTQEFTYHSVSMELSLPTTNASEILELINERFDEVWAPGILYRASGITLRSFVHEPATMNDLFGAFRDRERRAETFRTVDTLNKRYGNQTIHLASSLFAIQSAPARLRAGALLLDPEQKMKSLRIPYLGTAL